jgi:hypothetical protein
MQVVQKCRVYSELGMGRMGKMDMELVLCFERSRDPCMSLMETSSKYPAKP